MDDTFSSSSGDDSRKVIVSQQSANWDTVPKYKISIFI